MEKMPNSRTFRKHHTGICITGRRTWEGSTLEMTREKLKQYRALRKEIDYLDRQIEKLREQDIQAVTGTVMSSGKDFPYIKTRVTVTMDEPEQKNAIEKRIAIKEHRMEQAQELAEQIERYIASIPDSTDRQIFEMAFLEGKTQKEIAEQVQIERSYVSKRIDRQLKKLDEGGGAGYENRSKND